MSYPGVDGAWTYAVRVVHLHCDKCGEFGTLRVAFQDRAVTEALTRHLREKHGGVL